MIVSKVLQENSMFKRDKNFFLHIFNEWTKKEKEYNQISLSSSKQNILLAIKYSYLLPVIKI